MKKVVICLSAILWTCSILASSIQADTLVCKKNFLYFGWEGKADSALENALFLRACTLFRKSCQLFLAVLKQPVDLFVSLLLRLHDTGKSFLLLT